MAFEINDYSGFLFKNERKENDSQPTHQGSIKVNGAEYWMSAWIKTGKSGKRYFSMSFTEKESTTRQSQQPQSQQYSPSTDFDDDIPF